MTRAPHTDLDMRAMQNNSTRRIPCWILAIAVFSCLAYQPPAEAGSVAKFTGRAAIARIFQKDLKNHAAAQVKPLPQARTVHRYTASARAAQEKSSGLAADTHMTSLARPGRPLSPANAQRRYGLPSLPQVRETIHLPRGTPVRHTKVVAGEPGVGEITSPRPIPAEHIRRVIRLP